MTPQSNTYIERPYSLSKQAQRDAWLAWFKCIYGVPCLAITFTHFPDVSNPRRIRLLKEFVARVNRHVFTTFPKSQRAGKKLALIPINESKYLGGEIHHHLTLEIPADWNADDWSKFCLDTWIDLTGTGPQSNKVKVMKDEGWIEYCMKFSDKEVFGDAVVMDLLHLESAFVLH